MWCNTEYTNIEQSVVANSSRNWTLKNLKHFPISVAKITQLASPKKHSQRAINMHRKHVAMRIRPFGCATFTTYMMASNDGYWFFISREVAHVYNGLCDNTINTYKTSFDRNKKIRKHSLSYLWAICERTYIGLDYFFFIGNTEQDLFGMEILYFLRIG